MKIEQLFLPSYLRLFSQWLAFLRLLLFRWKGQTREKLVHHRQSREQKPRAGISMKSILIQWSSEMKESREKTFAPYHRINNLNDKKKSIVIPPQFNWICAAAVLTFCLTLMGLSMVWSRQMHLIFIPFYLKLSHQEAFVALTQSQSHAELLGQGE